MGGFIRYNANIRDAIESAVLVKGPAIAVFPATFFPMGPAIMTAPGEMILKNGRKIEIRVISAPNMVNRNSAHNPKRCADNLWASSCMRKAKVNINARLTKISGVITSPSGTCKARDSPTPMTSRALRIRCRISVGLNRKDLEIGGGL